MINKQNDGFTLVELMITIAILAILGAISVSIYTPFVRKAKCSDVESVAHEVVLKAVQYYSDSGSSPSGLNCNSTAIGVDLPSSVSTCVISGNGNSTAPVTVTITPAQTCPDGSAYVINENQSQGSWTP